MLIIIDNQFGEIRGAVEGHNVVLSVRAETPKWGPFHARLCLDTPMKLIHLYSTLTVYELDMFSFIVRRGDGRSLPRDVPVFEGELSEYKTMSAEGVTGLRIFPSFSQRTGKNRILLMVKEKEACSASHASSACGRCAKEKQPSARFDMNIGEIQALKKLAERALFNRDRLEVVMLKDATLSVKLSASRSGLEFDVVTPYVQKQLHFVNINNLASLAFWAKRALTVKGNPPLRFGDNRLGMLFWIKDSPLMTPYVRIFMGENSEIMNLTKLNLCCLMLLCDFVAWKSVCVETVSQPVNIDTFTSREVHATQTV